MLTMLPDDLLSSGRAALNQGQGGNGVDLENSSEIVPVGRADVGPGNECGVVDHSVHLSESVLGQSDQFLRASVLGQVTNERDGMVGAEFVDRFLREVSFEAIDHDLGSFFHAQLGDRFANSRGATGDDDGLVLESHDLMESAVLFFACQ